MSINDKWVGKIKNAGEDEALLQKKGAYIISFVQVLKLIMSQAQFLSFCQ